MSTQGVPVHIPSAFFPVDSTVPLAETDATGTGLQENTELASELTAFLHSARTRVMSSQDVQLLTGRVAAELVHVVGRMGAVRRQLEARNDRSASEDALRRSLVTADGTSRPEAASALGTGVVHPDRLATYDRYFRVFRVNAMTPQEFASQVAATSSHVAIDLENTVLGMDELVSLVDAIAEMMRTVGLLQPVLASQDELARLATPADREGAQLGARAALPDDRDVATRRWIVGHHFFDLAAMLCRQRIFNTLAALEAREWDAAAGHIESARVLLRGTTAGMWFAAQFPKEIYIGNVRPQMEAEQEHGFSGTDNADYERMKVVKGAVKDHVRGMTVSPSAAGFLSAFEAFLESDIEDAEHHTLIAAAKVGLAQSLLQRADHGGADTGPNALDMLRELRDDRRDYLFELRRRSQKTS